jgi:hypothetical protein
LVINVGKQAIEKAVVMGLTPETCARLREADQVFAAKMREIDLEAKGWGLSRSRQPQAQWDGWPVLLCVNSKKATDYDVCQGRLD